MLRAAGAGVCMQVRQVRMQTAKFCGLFTGTHLIVFLHSSDCSHGICEAESARLVML